MTLAAHHVCRRAVDGQSSTERQRTSTWKSGKAISHLGFCRDRCSRCKWGARSLAHDLNRVVLDCEPKPTHQKPNNISDHYVAVLFVLRPTVRHPSHGILFTHSLIVLTRVMHLLCHFRGLSFRVACKQALACGSSAGVTSVSHGSKPPRPASVHFFFYLLFSQPSCEQDYAQTIVPTLPISAGLILPPAL